MVYPLRDSVIIEQWLSDRYTSITGQQIIKIDRKMSTHCAMRLVPTEKKPSVQDISDMLDIGTNPTHVIHMIRHFFQSQIVSDCKELGVLTVRSL